MSKPVYLWTVHDANKEYNSSAKYEQLDSGKFVEVGTPAFNVEACKLANLFGRMSQLCHTVLGFGHDSLNSRKSVKVICGKLNYFIMLHYHYFKLKIVSRWNFPLTITVDGVLIMLILNHNFEPLSLHSEMILDFQCLSVLNSLPCCCWLMA